MPIKLQFSSFTLSLLALDEQRHNALANMENIQQSITKYFYNCAKATTFEVGQKFLLWDFDHAGKEYFTFQILESMYSPICHCCSGSCGGRKQFIPLEG